MDAYNKRIEERRRWNMDAWIDEAKSRGREEGKIEMVLEMLRERQPISNSAKKFTHEH